MSEENTQDLPEGTEQPEQKAPELSPIEQKALEMGWRPKEEFDGDEEAFIDAKEFVHRAPLFEKISSQSKSIKRLEAALEGMRTHYTKVQQTEYQRALKDLKAQQEAAVEEGDLTKYHALNERREAIEQEHQELVEGIQAPVTPQVPEELQQWVSRNPWVEQHPHMRVFADKVAETFVAKVRAGLMTPADVLREVEKQVRVEFPNKFRNPNKDKPSAVEGSTTKRSTKADDGFEMSADEKRIMNTVLATKDKNGKPYITKEAYIADLKKMKGLE